MLLHSYSCLPNVKQTISNNNHRLLQLHRMKESTQDSKLCNCRQKSSCPLDGKCLTKCVVYKATVTETTSNNQETYIGLTENEFKTRFNLHKSSFKLENKRTSTTLSDHVWKLKKKNINFNISWQVVKRVKPFAPSNKVCGLCLQEKLSILRSAPSLNKRSEIFGHCIHKDSCNYVTANYVFTKFSTYSYSSTLNLYWDQSAAHLFVQQHSEFILGSECCCTNRWRT